MNGNENISNTKIVVHAPSIQLPFYWDKKLKINMRECEVFQEISVGGMTKEELIHRLVEKNIQFNEYAHVLFEHSHFLPPDQSERVQLVKVKLSDFDIDKPGTFKEIVDQATAANLRLCPLYLGAFLRLNYFDQAEGPYLHIASMKPESDEDYPNGLYLRNHENSLWLRGYRASDDWEYSIDSEFIFLK